MTTPIVIFVFGTVALFYLAAMERPDEMKEREYRDCEYNLSVCFYALCVSLLWNLYFLADKFLFV